MVEGYRMSGTLVPCERVLIGVRRKRILMALEACKGYLLGSPASRGMGKGLADALREEQSPNNPCSSDVKTTANKVMGRIKDFG